MKMPPKLSLLSDTCQAAGAPGTMPCRASPGTEPAALPVPAPAPPAHGHLEE